MDRLGSLSLHSLVPLVVWQVNSDTGDTGQSVLAVVAMLLAGALFIALCVALLFMAFRRIGKHQKSIVQELEKLGLERTDNQEAAVAVYEGLVGGTSVAVVFSFKAGMREAQFGVFLSRPLGFGLKITRRPGPSWPRGSRVTRELFDQHFEVEAEDPERMSSLLESDRLLLAIARVLDSEDIFLAAIREDHIDTILLITDKTDPRVVARVINTSVALERLLRAEPYRSTSAASAISSTSGK